MTALGLCARWAHLGAGVFLVGTFAFLLLAGRSDRLTVVAWERSLTRWTRWAAGLALLPGPRRPRAAGVGRGGLLPFALLLRAAGQEAGADARPFAVLAARSFSQMSLVAVLVVAATGIWNAWNQIGNVASLLGTRYGNLLLLKLGLFLPIIALAAVKRLRPPPPLSGE